MAGPDYSGVRLLAESLLFLGRLLVRALLGIFELLIFAAHGSGPGEDSKRPKR